MSSSASPVIAIDGGGTRCRFALAQPGQRILVEAGPANATSDFRATIDCMMSGLTALANEANVSVDSLYNLPAFVGLAGVKSRETIDRLTQALPLTQPFYAEDRLAAVRGAIGTQNGFLVHCGTGSFFAVQMDAHQRFAGGWGSVLGDEASAQWVGRQALILTLQHVDGFLPASTLAQELLARFEGTDGILNFASQATPDQFGSLAPMVTEQARSGDVIGKQVMQTAASYIATGLDQMGWTTDMPICFSGGIGPECTAYLPSEKQAAIIEPRGTPIDGAIELAFEFATSNNDS